MTIATPAWGGVTTKRCAECRQWRPLRAYWPAVWQSSVDELTDCCEPCTENLRASYAHDLAQYFEGEVRAGRLVAA